MQYPSGEKKKHSPTMFTVLNVVASAPSTVTDVELLWASRCIPPRAVVPLIAFVTAISGL